MRAMLMIGLVSLCGVCFGQEAGPQGKNQPARKAERLDAFDQIVGYGNSIAEWRSWWGTMLEAMVRSDGRKYALNRVEQHQLRKAGSRDLDLVIGRLESAREEFDGLKADADGESDDPKTLAEKREQILIIGMKKLRKDVGRGPFHADSDYEKVLRKMKEPRALRFSLSPDRI